MFALDEKWKDHMKRSGVSMKTGICSVTFKELSVQEIVGRVREAGLEAIEWAGNVHVPPGDLAVAPLTRHGLLEADDAPG